MRAALDLLAEHSVDRLTTRRVASKVGISQPALFRHFSSRDEILIAVLDHVRESLASEATRILASGLPAKQAVAELAAALLGYVGRHPGMPRLLFYDAATSADEAEGSSLRPRLRQLLDMQRALLGELMARALTEGELPSEVEPSAAARLLLTLVQGRILAWHLDGESGGPEEGLAELLNFYWAGLEAWSLPGPSSHASAAEGEGAKDSDGTVSSSSSSDGTVPPSDGTVPSGEVLIHFDAREDLAQGLDPFASIRAHLARLRPDGLLVLEVPFLPEPLLALLDSEGWTCEVEASEGNHQIRILGPEAAPVLDLRELEAPEPMVQILEKSTALAPGEALLARLPRVPRMLLPRLVERGLAPQWIETREGGVYLALVATTSEAQA